MISYYDCTWRANEIKKEDGPEKKTNKISGIWSNRIWLPNTSTVHVESSRSSDVWLSSATIFICKIEKNDGGSGYRSEALAVSNDPQLIRIWDNVIRFAAQKTVVLDFAARAERGDQQSLSHTNNIKKWIEVKKYVIAGDLHWSLLSSSRNCILCLIAYTLHSGNDLRSSFNV